MNFGVEMFCNLWNECWNSCMDDLSWRSWTKCSTTTLFLTPIDKSSEPEKGCYELKTTFLIAKRGEVLDLFIYCLPGQNEIRIWKIPFMWETIFWSTDLIHKRKDFFAQKFVNKNPLFIFRPKMMISDSDSILTR